MTLQVVKKPYRKWTMNIAIKTVIPWGGMLQMKRLLDKTGISKKILKIAVPLKRRQWFDGLFENIRRTELPLSLQKFKLN